VGKWRRRFVERRLDGLLDEPRPGAPREIGDDDVERVVVKNLEDKPPDATHWSTRDLAKKVGMSPSSVGRIWKAFGLKPWMADTFKLSKDPQFVDKVRDVVGLYLNPPDKAVCCASTRRHGYRPWTAPSRSCPCARAKWSAGPMTRSVTGSPTCSPP
jgi:transposase